MDTYYYIFEVEPLPGNPKIAHTSRAVVHIWVMAKSLSTAREDALDFLKSDNWKVTEEKAGYLPTPDQIESMGAEELSNYQAAQLQGFHSVFYYWHRSE